MQPGPLTVTNEQGDEWPATLKLQSREEQPAPWYKVHQGWSAVAAALKLAEGQSICLAASSPSRPMVSLPGEPHFVAASSLGPNGTWPLTQRLTSSSIRSVLNLGMPAGLAICQGGATAVSIHIEPADSTGVHFLALSLKEAASRYKDAFVDFLVLCGMFCDFPVVMGQWQRHLSGSLLEQLKNTEITFSCCRDGLPCCIQRQGSTLHGIEGLSVFLHQRWLAGSSAGLGAQGRRPGAAESYQLRPLPPAPDATASRGRCTIAAELGDSCFLGHTWEIKVPFWAVAALITDQQHSYSNTEGPYHQSVAMLLLVLTLHDVWVDKLSAVHNFNTLIYLPNVMQN